MFAAAKAQGWSSLNLAVPPSLLAEAQQVSNIQYPDYTSYEKVWLEFISAAFPNDKRYGQRLARHTQGWYVPENRVLPLGDNRDNSHDGRFFGPVRINKVLGKGAFIYWPLWPSGRAGKIK